MQGENEWSHAQSFPEITTTDMEMAVAHGNGPDANRAAYERRMWWWLALLLTLYTVYVVKSW
jgi:hypothetical protein